MDEQELRAAVARLLRQCEREERNPLPADRYLFVSEIYGLLGIGPAADYSALKQAIADEKEG